jgi:16S rRNA (uracil1498-N3)-methyltransferase
MSLPRVFVRQTCSPGASVDLDPGDTHHLASVLRLQPGAAIAVVSEGVAWRADLVELTRDRARALIVERSQERSQELPVTITVLQAIPKGTKMDDVVEKVIELGAARIVPVRCERSYGGDSENKIERWRRVAAAAARQSRRLVVPEVDASTSFHEAIARFCSTAQVIVAHEAAPPGSLARALERTVRDQLAIAIGPEGSFSDDELQIARTAGCAIASLGPTILRTETAAAAMIAAVAALRGWW